MARPPWTLQCARVPLALRSPHLHTVFATDCYLCALVWYGTSFCPLKCRLFCFPVKNPIRCSDLTAFVITWWASVISATLPPGIFDCKFVLLVWSLSFSAVEPLLWLGAAGVNVVRSLCSAVGLRIQTIYPSYFWIWFQVIDDDDVEKEANSTWAGIIYGQISIYLVVYAKNLRVEEQPNLPFFSEK